MFFSLDVPKSIFSESETRTRTIAKTFSTSACCSWCNDSACFSFRRVLLRLEVWLINEALNQTVRVINRLGDSDAFLPVGDRFFDTRPARQGRKLTRQGHYGGNPNRRAIGHLALERAEQVFGGLGSPR